MPMMAENPFKMGYDSELNTSSELEPDATSHYLTLIGILSWMINLGRFNIITKVSLLSSHVALPRYGHLGAGINAMTHIGQRYNSRLVYDPSYMPRRLYP